MTDWYERASKALQLAGYAKKSQLVYLRSIRIENFFLASSLEGYEDLLPWNIPVAVLAVSALG